MKELISVYKKKAGTKVIIHIKLATALSLKDGGEYEDISVDEAVFYNKKWMKRLLNRRVG